jgi:hypothetical protein
MVGTPFRMQEQNPCRKFTLHEPEGARQVGTSAVRWLDSVEQDLKTTGVTNQRWKSVDRDQWRAIIKEVIAHHGL